MTAESPLDGAAFFQGSNLHVSFYDTLYGNSAKRFDDLPWYNTLAEHCGPQILDAGCGSGRIMQALARPGRNIVAFDASAELLQQANVKARTIAGPQCAILLSRQRLETFKFTSSFNLILLGHYAFSNLLEPEQRQACLKQIAAHLAPRGLAVLHLPAADLLSRTIPQNEINNMRIQHKITTGIGADLVLQQYVSAMDYDPERKCRSITLHAVLADTEGNAIQHDQRRMHYACISAEDLSREAEEAGLAVINSRSGFKQQTGMELVAVLSPKPPVVK